MCYLFSGRSETLYLIAKALLFGSGKAQPYLRSAGSFQGSASTYEAELVPRNGDLRKRRLQTFSQLHRIVVGPEMHKEETGLFVEHVAVEGRYLDAVRK